MGPSQQDLAEALVARAREQGFDLGSPDGLSCRHAAQVARGDMTEPVIVAPPKR